MHFSFDPNARERNLNSTVTFVREWRNFYIFNYLRG